jgi:hypothetical protein
MSMTFYTSLHPLNLRAVQMQLEILNYYITAIITYI